MPQPPDFANIASSWLRDTDLTLSTGRSADLKQVDAYLTNYQGNKRPDNLEWLGRAIDTWLGGKTPTGSKPLGTRRDDSGAVTRLKTSVDAALRPVVPLAWDAQYPGIYIAQDLYRGNFWVPDDFDGVVRTALKTIASKPVGEGLLRGISKGCLAGRHKLIIEYTATFTMAAPLDDVSAPSRKKLQPATPGEEKLDINKLVSVPGVLAVQEGPVFVHGGGTSAVVCFKHTDKGPPHARRPAFIGLAHELIHAYHYILGSCYRAPCGGIMSGQDTGLMEEEMRTTGVGAYSKETPSENAIRAEHGIPLRSSYDPDKDWSAVVATGPATRLRRGFDDVEGLAPARARAGSF